MVAATGRSGRSPRKTPWLSQFEHDQRVPILRHFEDADGQLDDVDLTLHDLQLIRESFVNTLKGVFHPRIAYPKEEKPALVAPTVERAP